ncbi:MAG: hypothetical protein FWH51_05975 [Dehalococcoidia bacterium]|nr:hypothetical protein [Dehalococcoidia bacterium]
MTLDSSLSAYVAGFPFLFLVINEVLLSAIRRENPTKRRWSAITLDHLNALIVPHFRNFRGVTGTAVALRAGAGLGALTILTSQGIIRHA